MGGGRGISSYNFNIVTQEQKEMVLTERGRKESSKELASKDERILDLSLEGYAQVHHTCREEELSKLVLRVNSTAHSRGAW